MKNAAKCPSQQPSPLIYTFQSLFELELAGCNEVTEAGLWACLTPRIVSLSVSTFYTPEHEMPMTRIPLHFLVSGLHKHS